MQQDWDEIDKLIKDSEPDVVLDSNYDQILLSKLRKRRTVINQSYIGAVSFIMAGFLAIFIYTSNIQYTIANVEAKARSEMINIKYNYGNYDIIKILLGE